MTAQQELRPLELPAAWTPAWCAEAAAALDAASRAGPAALKAVLPQEVVCGLLERCHQLLQGEPTLLEVWPKAEGQVPAVARPALLLLLGASFAYCMVAQHWCNTCSIALLPAPRPRLPRCPLCLPTRACRWRRPRAREWWLWAIRTASSTMSAACEQRRGMLVHACWLVHSFVPHPSLPVYPLLCRLEVVGSPSPSNLLVFNGDFVDRGAW